MRMPIMCSNYALRIHLLVTSVVASHDNLDRIRIRGSMPLTNGSGFGSCYFRHWPSRRQQKTKFFCLLFFEVTFTSFFKDKKSQNSRNQGFFYIFAWRLKDPDPYLWLMDPDPDLGGPKTYGSGFGSGSATLLVTIALSLRAKACNNWPVFSVHWRLVGAPV